jgi:hypothetical protein
MSSTVNALHFWPVAMMEAKHRGANQAQLDALTALRKVTENGTYDLGLFAELRVEMVEDILAVHVQQCQDMQLVVNGKWLLMAIEDDGYTVLTGSSLAHPRAGRPGQL